MSFDGATAHAIILTKSQAQKAVPIHGVTRTLFEAMVGRPTIASSMIKHGWIFPIPGTDLYDSGDVAICWARFLDGERPDTHPGGGKERKVKAGGE